jgi:hypothetical protein
VPRVGLNGTVVAVPHLEQVVLVSVRTRTLEPRLALHSLQRFGSFLNCFSTKKNCSPAVKTNSVLQSTHIKTLSANSMGFFRRHLKSQSAAFGLSFIVPGWSLGSM